VPQVSAAERILAEQAKLNIAAVELEKKRLAKMKAKQQKEIEQVVSFEKKMTELQIEINRRLEAEARKAEALQRSDHRGPGTGRGSRTPVLHPRRLAGRGRSACGK
jgi:hypothetical protein